ncbi:MAG: YihY/virulence factor BrkB family protein [Ilumatobacteraceae bacterium]
MKAPDLNIPNWAARLADVLRDTYFSWRDARTIRLGAGIAYYALFAAIPLVTLSIWLAQLIVDDDAVVDFLEKIGESLNIDEEAIASLVDHVSMESTQMSLGVLGLASLVFASAIVFSALQDAFDEMWELPVERGIWRKMRRRSKAFIIVGGGGVIIVLALVINAVSGLITRLIPGQSTVLDRLPELFSFVSGWVVLIGCLIILFQVLTRQKIAFVPLVIGAAITGGLLSIGTQVLNWYLANYASTSLTGAIASVFIALLWLYYVAQIVLVGGHLIRVLDGRRSAARGVQEASEGQEAQAGSV